MKMWDKLMKSMSLRWSNFCGKIAPFVGSQRCIRGEQRRPVRWSGKVTYLEFLNEKENRANNV